MNTQTNNERADEIERNQSRALPLAAHTPTPWSEGGSIISDAYGNEIARVSTHGAGLSPAGYTCPWHLSEGNALLIVRAVNNHAQLRDALERTIHPLAMAARLLGNTEAGDAALSAYNHARAMLIESQIPSS